MFKVRHKLLLKWSPPHHITEWLCNLYCLETIQGEPLDGEFHTRRLRVFYPREGMKLAEEQRDVEARKNKGNLTDQNDKEKDQENTKTVEENKDEEDSEENGVESKCNKWGQRGHHHFLKGAHGVGDP